MIWAQKKIGMIPTTVEVENRLIFIRDKNHLSDGSLLMKPGNAEDSGVYVTLTIDLSRNAPDMRENMQMMFTLSALLWSTFC